MEPVRLLKYILVKEREGEMVILTGKSGAGKTTVAKLLEEEHGFKRAVTCTTRPPREGEIDGVDYHFLSQEQFDEMEEKGMFAESAHTGLYSYGSLKESYLEDDSVIVLDPDGVRHVQECRDKEGYRVLTVYLGGDNKLLKNRLIKRGDDSEKVSKRLAEDDARFEGIEELCDLQFHQTEEMKAGQIALFLSEMAKADE